MLTASERIKLIRAISPPLASEEWPLIDLTLRQFKLPTTDQWEGSDKTGYLVQMMSDASDETLQELASHLGIEASPRSSNIEASFWLPDHLRLFISHLAKHKKQAASIQQS